MSSVGNCRIAISSAPQPRSGKATRLAAASRHFPMARNRSRKAIYGLAAFANGAICASPKAVRPKFSAHTCPR